jgi:hypothetical protein
MEAGSKKERSICELVKVKASTRSSMCKNARPQIPRKAGILPNCSLSSREKTLHPVWRDQMFPEYLV